MTSIRRFQCDDLLKFNNVNLDELTETYNLPYYMQYLSRWPSLFVTAHAPGNQIAGYICGKAEGRGENWHGHVTAVTVAAEYRRLRLAKHFMDYLERVSDQQHRAYFVDLYVRCTNAVAIRMYELFGYTAYRRVKGYYSGDDETENEDAFDMRKALSIDTEKASVVPHDPFIVAPGDVD